MVTKVSRETTRPERGRGVSSQPQLMTHEENNYPRACGARCRWVSMAVPKAVRVFMFMYSFVSVTKPSSASPLTTGVSVLEDEEEPDEKR